MTGLTKAARQAILDDYLARHNGRFDAGEFLTEVRAGGEDHPAFGWFTWDDDRAAHEHRLWQARTFARDLRVTFNVETLERGAVRIRTVEAPRLVSPLEGRQKGGSPAGQGGASSGLAQRFRRMLNSPEAAPYALSVLGLAARMQNARDGATHPLLDPFIQAEIPLS